MFVSNVSSNAYIIPYILIRKNYFTHFHSRDNYGIIFWGISATSQKLLIQTKIFRIMLGLGYRSSCRTGFNNLTYYPIPCLYTLSLMNFVVSNPDKFQTNITVHSLNNRQKNHRHRPTICFSSFKKG